MKRILIILLALFLTTGCICINDASLDDLINTTINSKYSLYNHVNSGFKYYLPRTLKSVVTDEYNEIIKSKYYDYYLYVDLVSYYNKKNTVLVEDKTIYYSKFIGTEKNKGIVNIKEENDKLVVNIIYNYASIEVKCSKEDINEVVTNSLVILSSIKYNDDVIKNLLDENILTSAEEQVNVFDTEKEDTNTLDVAEDMYTGNEEEDYDPDVIN